MLKLLLVSLIALALSGCVVGRLVEGFRQFDTNKPAHHESK